MDRSDGKPDASPASTATELVPWAATAEAQRGSPGAPTKKRVFGILAPVALGLAGLLLGAGAVHLVRAHGWPAGLFSGTEPEAAREPQPTAAERVEQRMMEAFTALKSDIAALQLAVTRNRGDDRASAMTKRLDELAAKLEAAKEETTSSIARLAAKIDPLRQETSAELHALAARLDRLEPRGETVTAAKPPEAATKPQEAAAEARPAAGPQEPARKPQVIKGWVLRGVYDGLALVEGADGPIEVAPGETLPGAGRVKSIERSGKGWVVVTSRGVIDGTRGRF
jgi:hypothetical protein